MCRCTLRHGHEAAYRNISQRLVGRDLPSRDRPLDSPDLFVLHAVHSAAYRLRIDARLKIAYVRNVEWSTVRAGIANIHLGDTVENIIAGRFQTKAKADAAAAAIVRYVDRSDICIFHNNPPGQHGTLMPGGAEKTDPGSEAAGGSAASTALAAGLTAGVIGLAGGPVTALAAAGVAAYTGSLIGAMGGMQDAESHQLPHLRPAGVILAVRIARPGSEKFVIGDLRNCGAEDIEQAEGEWRDGDWVDFNPIQEPRLVAA